MQRKYILFIGTQELFLTVLFKIYSSYERYLSTSVAMFFVCQQNFKTLPCSSIENRIQSLYREVHMKIK